MKTISNQTFDEERALYHLQNARVENCTFAGPADGESALKESDHIEVANCTFSLRYPLWHTQYFLVENSTLDVLTRASLWYSAHGKFVNTTVEGVKCLRECADVEFRRTKVVSPEFGWRCRDISIFDSEMTSEYFLFETKHIDISKLQMKGKYSFQYTEDVTIADSDLDTKDAFWHAKNVTVKNCRIKGEYLGWYSDGLTLIDCEIIGTQPLCYCKNLTLKNCTMIDTDLAFEYSEVNADIRGEVLSVKNPHSGEIVADGYGAIILEDSVMENTCVIRTRDSK